MQGTLAFVKDYLSQQMMFKMNDKPIVYELINTPSSSDKQKQRSILSTKSRDDSLQIRQPQEIRINSIDLVQQKHDGSRVKTRVSKQTLEQFIQNSRKRKLTTFMQERNNRKRRQRSVSPSSFLDSGRGKIFHIGCDYRLKPKFQQSKYQGY